MMQIIWSERAFVRRQAIEDYILYSFGFAAHTDYVKAVDEWKQMVVTNPNIGKIEPLLTGMRKEYRSSVISKLTKCIYYIESDFIVIVFFLCLCLLNDLVLKGMRLIGKKYLEIYLQVVFSN